MFNYEAWKCECNQKIIKILKKFSKVFFLGKDIEINHSCLYIYNDENFILWFV
jgi:hypothetical protein